MIDATTNLASGIVRATGPSTPMSITDPSTLTIGTGAVLEGGFQRSGNALSLINRGRLAAGPGQQMAISLQQMSNTGVIEAFDGGVTAFSLASSVPGIGGTIRATGAGSVVSFSGAPLRSNNAVLVTTGGGQISFRAGVDLQGQSLTIDSSSARVLSGGYFNGVLNLPTTPAPLDFDVNLPEGVPVLSLSGLTINGNLSADAERLLINDCTLNGTLRYARAVLSGSVGGTGRIVMHDEPAGAIDALEIEGQTIQLGSALTLEAGRPGNLQIREGFNRREATLNAGARFVVSASQAQLNVSAHVINLTGHVIVTAPGNCQFVALPRGNDGSLPPSPGALVVSGSTSIEGGGLVTFDGANVTFQTGSVMRFGATRPANRSIGRLMASTTVRGHLIIDGPTDAAGWAGWPIGSRQSLIQLNGAVPPQAVFTSVTLPAKSPPTLPGGRKMIIADRIDGFVRYYEVVVVPACTSLANVAGPNHSTVPDEALTADDIVVYLGWYFAGDLRADVAGANQATAVDSELTADDIIVFLNRYFGGCP
jgi:hypothetical protein